MSTKRYMCGVPFEHCMGGEISRTSSFLGASGRIKAHTTSQEAYKCMERYLVEVEGYTKGRNHEFHKPGHPCRVLTKPSQFGGELRHGKSLESGRWMPSARGRSGVVISK